MLHMGSGGRRGGVDRTSWPGSSTDGLHRCTAGSSAAGNSRWCIPGCLPAAPCSTAHDAQTSGWVINALALFGLALAFFGGCCCVASDAPALDIRCSRIQEVGGAEITHLSAAGARGCFVRQPVDAARQEAVPEGSRGTETALRIRGSSTC